MESIFEVPWRDVRLEHVRAFVESASGEGLTWEGKATASLRGLKGKIVAGVCGLANQLGGFFIVGADEQGEAWSLPGVEDDARQDAHDWFCNVLDGNLVEPPPFDPRTWHLEDGRLVAVIRVERAAVPPCMTKDGLVWQRLVGITKKVTDPRVLRELIQSGQMALDAAEARAVRAVNRVIEGNAQAGTAESMRIAVALAPTAAREDYSGRLFTPSFKEELHEAVTVLERSVSDWHRHDEGVMGRDGYVVRRGRHAEDSWQWAIQARWDGTVVVELAAPRECRIVENADVIVSQAWHAAARALPALTGIPDREHVPTHLAVRSTGGFRLIFPAAGFVEVSTGERPIQRWTTMAEPSEDDRQSVYRELARSAGVEVFEPGEAEEPPSEQG